jgi:peptide/nickel transport system substrate-binding protein
MGWLVLVALLCLALAAFPACTSTGEQQEEEEEEGGPAIPYKNDGLFVQMTIGLPETLDPPAAYDNASGEQIDYVYETLIDYDRDKSGDFVGVLATDFVWNAADLTWTFTIREGVKFHEGGDLSPEDVEYSFERGMIYDRLGGPMWMLFEPLHLAAEYADVTFADVDAAIEVDGNNVVFTLADAAYKLIFLQTICYVGCGSIVDKEWCIANGEWDGTEADVANHYQQEDGSTYLWSHMNGTGPWKLNAFEQGVQIKMERFDGYWRDPAPFDLIITQLVEEWTTRKQALLAGDVDFVLVDKMYIPEIEGVADLLKIKDLPELTAVAVFLNQDIEMEGNDYVGSGQLDGNGIPGNFFSDVDVRKGFCYAFDYDTFLEQVMLGEALQVASPIVDGLYGFNPNAQMYTFDLAKAEEHMRAAWGGEVWEKGFKVTLLYNAGNDMRKAVCEILAENLFTMNNKFQITVLPLDWGTGMVPLLRSYRLTSYVCGWGADYPHAHNFAVPFMSSTGTFSKFMGYGSAELDAKLQAALLEPDPEEQLDKYYELQQDWYDDPGGIMLYQASGRRWFTKYIHGFYFNPMISGDAGPLYDMSKSAS